MSHEAPKTKANPVAMSNLASRKSILETLDAMKQLLEETQEWNFREFSDFDHLLDRLNQEWSILLKDAANYTKDSRYTIMYNRFFDTNISMLVKSAQRAGYRLGKDKDIADRIGKNIYVLLEEVRNCNRQKAYYIILRIFAAGKKPLPKALEAAINPMYSDDIFQTLLYGFIAGIMSASLASNVKSKKQEQSSSNKNQNNQSK